MTFEQWLHEANLICWSWYGMSLYDLPDMCFRDAYDDGFSPESFMNDELGDLGDLARAVLG